jgi:hypothetical protein
MARTIGTIQCKGFDCGEKVAVTETAGASLSCKCQFCGLSSYAPPGTKEARNIRKLMQPLDEPDLPPAAPTKTTPPPKVEQKPKARAAFDLTQLTG